MAREFVSGLPGSDLHKDKTFEQVIAESGAAINERRKLNERKRWFSSKSTPQTRANIKRMTGEKDD
jgi:hypothetical protein